MGRRAAGRWWRVAAVGLVMVVAATACGGDNSDGSSAPATTQGTDTAVTSGSTVAGAAAMCASMDTVVAVWTTQAPPEVLGDPEALADFAGSLQTSFTGALTEVAAVAPASLDDDIATTRVSLARLYATAIRYVAGDMGAVPTQPADDLAAFGRIKDWARPQCPGVDW
jgi:hypothetical protein